MRVLDLFSGLGGWSSAFIAAGDQVVTVDIESKFKPTFVRDILQVDDLADFETSGRFDLVLASPPCNCFSIASVYRHWRNGVPADNATREAIRLVKHTTALISEYCPDWHVLENPRGMMRKILGKPDYEIAQCRYGAKIMKPTDLWGRLPPAFAPQKCKNGNADHERASRSAKSGLQGINNSLNLLSGSSPLRAKIPFGLSAAVRASILLFSKRK